MADENGVPWHRTTGGPVPVRRHATRRPRQTEVLTPAIVGVGGRDPPGGGKRVSRRGPGGRGRLAADDRRPYVRREPRRLRRRREDHAEGTGSRLRRRRGEDAARGGARLRRRPGEHRARRGARLRRGPGEVLRLTLADITYGCDEFPAAGWSYLRPPTTRSRDR